jgi:fructose-1,6-bisphosphatase II / sedoheptulose-1,7-bisphosphatase
MNKLTFEIEAGALTAVENAAIAAHKYVGSGDELAADKAAISAMFDTINAMAIDATILFGEGDEFDSPKLYDGQKLGSGGSAFDIALDALEGTTLAAKAMHDALSVIAIAPKNGLLNAPSLYMEKIAIGKNYPRDIVDLDKSPQENVKNLAQFKGVSTNEIGVCVLDRPRHAKLIADLREVGARVYLIPDGDVAGVIFTNHATSDVDIYMGIGAGPAGVLAAAAQACFGGHFQGRFIIKSEDDKNLARKAGIIDFNTKYYLDDIVKSPVVFAATGITNGTLLRGVHQRNGGFETQSILMNSETNKIQKVKTLRLVDSPK